MTSASPKPRSSWKTSSRAQRGEDVRIATPDGGSVQLKVVETGTRADASERPKRLPGRWKGRLHIPEDKLFEPLSEKELEWLSGASSK